MTDRLSELSEAEDRAREFIRDERNASINDRLDQIDRLGAALARKADENRGGTTPR